MPEKKEPMLTEKEKMIAGQPYDGFDPQLVEERLRAREICQRINHMPARKAEAERLQLAAELFGVTTDVYITPPFYCDYGPNIKLGSKVYFNFNCVILDVTTVTIGDRVLFGPGVHIYTATHPLDAEERSRVESGRPVHIGDDVWIGGGSIICPGVTIGAASVIGAGSVVTRDIPAGVLAAGNPCRVIRPIPAKT